jgi:hypothetical protein
MDPAIEIRTTFTRQTQKLAAVSGSGIFLSSGAGEGI